MTGTVDPPLLALYGSLRRGQPPHAELGLERLLRYVGPCTLAGILHDFGDWPGLVPGAGTVTAELFEVVSRDALPMLDAYEACDAAMSECGLFVREEVALIAPAGISAFVYLYNCETGGAPVIESGDWVACLRARGKTGKRRRMRLPRRKSLLFNQE
jgi:gamma-glutamylcyclotransferase (GGCT)/AIG2-like uncharacterized protein YtfP